MSALPGDAYEAAAWDWPNQSLYSWSYVTEGAHGADQPLLRDAYKAPPYEERWRREGGVRILGDIINGPNDGLRFIPGT